MKIFKKNQLAILVISLMLITAGYLNYDSSINGKTEEVSTPPEESVDIASIGDAELVNANVVENTTTEQSNIVQEEVEEKKEEIKETNTEINQDTNSSKDYFVASKLERNIMYSQMIERYQAVVNNSNSAADQKAISQTEINKINDLQNAIMIAENLLTTKGFTQNIIFVNGDSISVIIGKENLTPEEIAQIQNIISRELKSEVENIHISVK
ncbi:MAG: SpoIIIAH-like family protein [Clostridia bacterium]|nr:SpoIIIAH-like family protein [Clostridia bacterium]